MTEKEEDETKEEYSRPERSNVQRTIPPTRLTRVHGPLLDIGSNPRSEPNSYKMAKPILLSSFMASVMVGYCLFDVPRCSFPSLCSKRQGVAD